MRQPRILTGRETYDILASLDLTVEEASYEFGVTERTIRRWLATGCTGTSAAAVVYSRVLQGLIGDRWRRDAVLTGKPRASKMSAA